MTNIFKLLSGVLLTAILSAAQDGPDDTLWVDLFNGEDFEGLYTYDYDHGNHVYDSSLAGVPLFRPWDNMIQVYADDGGHRGHIGTIKSDYSYFHMKVDIQINSGNCGIMYHLRDDLVHDNNDGRLYDVFPPSIEAQGQKGAKGDCWVIANVWMTTTVDPNNTSQYDPGGVIREFGGVTTGGRDLHGPHEFEDGSQDAWNTVEVIAFADSHVVHLVNGNVVFEGWDIKYTPGNTTTSGAQLPSQPYEKIPFGYGQLTLQAEMARVNYRNWKVAELKGCMDPAADNYKSYLVKHDSSMCVYSIEGCTDSNYLEYNPDANISSQDSCITPVVKGCMDSSYAEYNPEANVSDETMCVTGFRWKYGRLPADVVLNAGHKMLMTGSRGAHALQILDFKGRVMYAASGYGPHVYDFSSIRNPGLYLVRFREQSRGYQFRTVIIQ